MVDSAVRELMNESVIWERATGRDIAADASYAAPVTIRCFTEERFGAGSGIAAVRRPDETTVDARLDVYFDASDANVQLFGLEDRFTLAAESAEVVKSKAAQIVNFFGPGGDAWLKVVSF